MPNRRNSDVHPDKGTGSTKVKWPSSGSPIGNPGPGAFKQHPEIQGGPKAEGPGETPKA